MSGKPLVLRERASQDVDAAIDYYASEAGLAVATGFIDALERAYRSIGLRPATGSPRYGIELDLPGLRHRAMKRYPYLIFYVERSDCIELWRVLHMRRDIPASMQDPQT